MSRQSTRKTAETVALRRQIWDLFLGRDRIPGITQNEIGKMLGITQQAVSYHVRVCIIKFENENLTSAGQYLARELKRIAYWESQACQRYEWAKKAWRKSIGVARITTRSTKPVHQTDKKGTLLFDKDGNPKISTVTSEETVKEEKVVGDPRLLRAMEEADESIRSWHARRCRLLGLEAPKKVTLVDERAPENMSDDDLQQAVLKTAEALRTGIYIPANIKGNGHNRN